MELSDIGESGWIQWIREKFPQAKGVKLGIGDDSAYVGNFLLTTDLLIEGVHFQKEFSPSRILGRKALAVNISDISAMGGIPRYALLGLGFPKNLKVRWAKDFIVGFEELAGEYKVELIGGDTVASDLIVISVTVLGEMEKGKKPILRSGAKAEDNIYITGTVGDSALGLKLIKRAIQKKMTAEDIHFSKPVIKHLDPSPRVEVGRRLVGIANSMIDLSDGLIWDLSHILKESSKIEKISAFVELEKIPVSKDFKDFFKNKHFELEEPIRILLSGGEDYELLFTAKKEYEEKIKKISSETGVEIHKIGRLKKAENIELVVLDRTGKEIKLKKPWFEHFPSKNTMNG